MYLIRHIGGKLEGGGGFSGMRRYAVTRYIKTEGRVRTRRGHIKGYAASRACAGVTKGLANLKFHLLGGGRP